MHVDADVYGDHGFAHLASSSQHACSYLNFMCAFTHILLLAGLMCGSGCIPATLA